jgi:hypothetical protein
MTIKEIQIFEKYNFWREKKKKYLIKIIKVYS